jgi:hypothetical protein
MFNQLKVRNRRTAVLAIFVLWLVGIFVAFPGQFIGMVLLSLYANIEDPSGIFLAAFLFHAMTLLLGPVLVMNRVPLWTLKLAGNGIEDPQGRDAPLVSTLEMLTVAIGKPAVPLLVFDDVRPNACVLQVGSAPTILLTSAVRDLPPKEREALLALALSRTLTNRYLRALQNWVLAPTVLVKMIPRWTYLVMVLMLIAVMTIFAGLGLVSKAIAVLLCLAFPVKMLFLSHVVVRRGFALHVGRSVALSQDAEAVSIFRYPPAFRSLFDLAAATGGASFNRHQASVLRLPIWVLPTDKDGVEAMLKRRKQLDHIDPIGAAAHSHRAS